MLEFEASYRPFESLYKYFASHMTIYIQHLVYLPAVSSHEILYPHWIFGHKIACFYASEPLPEQTRMQKYIYGKFANFNPRAICC